MFINFQIFIILFKIVNTKTIAFITPCIIICVHILLVVHPLNGKRNVSNLLKKRKLDNCNSTFLFQNPIMLVKDFELQEVGYQPMQKVDVEEDKHIINLKPFIYISIVTNHYIIFHY